MKISLYQGLFHPLNLMLSLLGFCLVLSSSIVFILNLKVLYSYDVKSQNLSARYQMSEEEIMKNYDTLIQYNSLFYQGELKFPTLPMSQEGKIHFEEVKKIFDFVQILLIFSFCFFFPLAWYQLRMNRNPGFFLLTPCLLSVIGILSGIFAASDWDSFFVAFHQLFFQNDYWLFDPATDPVINLLPDSYFFHCLIGILFFMGFLLLLFLVAYLYFKNRLIKKNS